MAEKLATIFGTEEDKYKLYIKIELIVHFTIKLAHVDMVVDVVEYIIFLNTVQLYLFLICIKIQKLQ